jgi:hypothetical protein
MLRIQKVHKKIKKLKVKIAEEKILFITWLFLTRNSHNVYFAFFILNFNLLNHAFQRPHP